MGVSETFNIGVMASGRIYFFSCTHCTFCMLEKQLSNLYFIILAPGSYDVEKVENVVHQSSPAFSFGVKYKEHQTENLPGKH